MFYVSGPKDYGDGATGSSMDILYLWILLSVATGNFITCGIFNACIVVIVFYILSYY